MSIFPGSGGEIAAPADCAHEAGLRARREVTAVPRHPHILTTARSSQAWVAFADPLDWVERR
jgi:hypothetical protein